MAIIKSENNDKAPREDRPAGGIVRCGQPPFELIARRSAGILDIQEHGYHRAVDATLPDGAVPILAGLVLAYGPLVPLVGRKAIVQDNDTAWVQTVERAAQIGIDL